MPLLGSAYPSSFVYLFEMICVCVCERAHVRAHAHALVQVHVPMHNSLSPDNYWTSLKFGFHVCIQTLKFY